MHKYVIKRILLTIPVLLGAVFLVFTIMYLNHKLGADLPFFEQFFNYLKGIVLHFDFGTSYRSGKPVFDSILSRFPTTFQLALWSMLLSSVLGIALGIISAVKQYSVLDNALTTLAMPGFVIEHFPIQIPATQYFISLAMLLSAMPGFWLGLMLMVLFALKLGWLPFGGVDTWQGYILPVITLSLGAAASEMRLTRSTMLETIRQDYIRTARSKGVPEKTVIWKHALRNALLPVVTSMGMNFGGSLGGAVIIETVFGMPGVGMLIVESIRQKDTPVVMAATMFLAVLFCFVMLGVDILYAYIDPRIKAKYKS